MLIPILYAASIASTAVLAYRYFKKPKGEPFIPPFTPPETPPVIANVPLKSDIVASVASLTADPNLVRVGPLADGTTWDVAPDYIGPVGIGEAAEIAKTAGMELPTPALVDAIWRQADLKLLPLPRAKNEVTQAVFDDQKRRINEQIDNRRFVLLGGTYKDVVTINGFPQLYGWHVEDGKNVGIPLHAPKTAGPGRIIQPPSGKAHGLFYKDYSQGVRLVRKVS